MTDDINIVASCKDGVLPVAGGLLDQSSYYVQLSSLLHGEEMQIVNERQKHG